MSIIAASWAAVRPGPMSVSGQKRKLALLNGMSAPPPKADIRRKDRYVRYVPNSDLGPRLSLVRLSPAMAETATAGLFAAKAPIQLSVQTKG
jgi:hypothetical protein